MYRLSKERLAVIAFLHDFGKCNRGFQAKADPGAKPRDTAGHVMEALGFFSTRSSKPAGRRLVRAHAKRGGMVRR
jgi:hypothetical protein